MKFSSLEQKVIKDLCDWAQKANDFKAVRHFFSEKAFPEETGLFTFSNEYEDRPPIILCINIEKYSEKDYTSIYNHILFTLHFLKKLERYGLVTISEGRYSEDGEYCIATFSKLSVIGIRKMQGDEWGYSFTIVKNGKEIPSELVKSGLTLRRLDNHVALPFHTLEVFTRFDGFDLVSSNIALEQELFDIVSNGFKTTEERMLETACQQLVTAKNILTQAEEHSRLALDDINQAKTNFEAAQKAAREQFEAEQKDAKIRFETEQANARKNIEYIQSKLERRFKESQDASESQFKETKAESIRQFEKARKDSKEQFETAQKDSKEQFDEAQKKSICALWLAFASIVASIVTTIIVAIYVPITIDRVQYERVNNVQEEILNKMEEIDLNTRPDSTLYSVPDQLDEISTTLKNVNSKLGKSARK